MHLKTETSVILPQSVTPSSYVLSMSIWCNNFWNDKLLKKLQVDLPYSLAINQCSRFTLEFKFTFLSMVDVSIYKVKMTSFNLSHQKDRFKIMLCVVEECISLNLISAQLQKETPPRWLTGDGTTNCWKKKDWEKNAFFGPYQLMMMACGGYYCCCRLPMANLTARPSPSSQTSVMMMSPYRVIQSAITSLHA